MREFTYRIDKNDRIVYLEGADPTLEQWRETLLAIFADPDYETGFDFLSDRRAIESPRSTLFIKAAVSFLRDHSEQVGQCKWASVVSTTVAYGMARMAQILSEDTEITVQAFTDIDEARRWLLAGKG